MCIKYVTTHMHVTCKLPTCTWVNPTLLGNGCEVVGCAERTQNLERKEKEDMEEEKEEGNIRPSGANIGTCSLKWARKSKHISCSCYSVRYDLKAKCMYFHNDTDWPEEILVGNSDQSVVNIHTHYSLWTKMPRYGKCYLESEWGVREAGEKTSHVYIC